MRLSRRIQLSPEVIDSGLQRLNCVSQNIIEVDIHPTVLALLTSASPDVVRKTVAELPLHKAGDLGKEDATEFSDAGMNTALSFSLHTVLLSRNRLTTTLGLVQFKNVVRLSLLGNRIQRIEDCEALSLLPSLQYLTLEFNPVTSLPHYRAHIFRICSWPDTLSQKKCRLRKLDTRSVLPAEVERAAECLQREKVTLGELVHRMRFLALLTEAEKRIALHNELRRRGVVLQDTVLNLTVESIVTRCSTQLLALIDVGAASHLARRLMSGKCRMCAMTPENSFNADTSTENEFSPVATSFAHSRSSSNILTLQSPYQADLTAFCKEWSRDVFRRAMTSLDHRICGLLLNIAHTLGEELTVMDVDHLNKLWFTQVAKVDSCKFYQCDKFKKNLMENKKLLIVTSRRETLREEKNEVARKNSTREEFIRVALSPSETHLHTPCVEAKEDNAGAVSLRSVSSISQDDVHGSDVIAIHDWQKPSSGGLDESCRKQPDLAKASYDAGNTEALMESTTVEGCNSDRVSVELPLTAPVPFPALKEEFLLEQEIHHRLNCHVRRRILRVWKTKAWRRRQGALCLQFTQKRLEGLLLLPTPTPHAICNTLQLIPRRERKYVFFKFWREQARRSYAPRLLRLAQLITRWRWRTYQQRIINHFAVRRRTQILNEVWCHWREALHTRVAETRTRLRDNAHNIDVSSNAMTGLQSSAQNNHRIMTISSEAESKELYETPFESRFPFKVATEATPGLTCSTKLSANGRVNMPHTLHMVSTPAVASHLFLPMITPNAGEATPLQPSSFCDKETQTTPSPSNDDLRDESRDKFCLEAKQAIKAMQVDRLRLVDRLISLEQRLSEESLRVQYREEEIEGLKQKLNAMMLREECMGSTISDYQRELGHLRAVVQALREERRDMLRPILH
ncbi:hypothetical protein TraAM80_05450 [Trypanosoma rangeli]|uniref:Uncharacterized protein n=1 Tax=Trypanosoma rangeli TaxID=5698 RepID=A0A422NEN6_TRYRA|nr:uncharacterized protein TraAM80_05450 [Trypanosoma rangeli]RNF03924.1 hypothetical protein TraAM80_05450 [Trypanosoma rangeli]|eukprot:RNF03924.1 hypothetical protein TraAM80_05450 [Trypanosoma rangeli]